PTKHQCSPGCSAMWRHGTARSMRPRSHDDKILSGEHCLWMDGPRLPGGEGGIRTHEPLAQPPVFKTGAFNRSATSPQSMQWLVFHSIRPRTPIRCPARRRAALSAGRFLENRGRNAIAAVLFAAVQGRIGDPEHLLGHPVLTTRDVVHAAEAEARGHV